MKERVLITGDKHGSFLPIFGLAENNDIDNTDILIIAGDAGYVWNEDYHLGIETIEQVFPGIIAFIDGNHENHAILNKIETSIWNGGKVHQIGERSYHLMRGEIYSVYGKNIFTFGGARSTDKDRREAGISWWEEEEPTEEEIDRGRKRLEDNLDEIDYIITHETPLMARPFIKRSKPVDNDYHIPGIFNNWYEMISKGKRFRKWYCGHMHVDQTITSKLRVIHNDILIVDDETPVRWA